MIEMRSVLSNHIHLPTIEIGAEILTDHQRYLALLFRGELYLRFGTSHAVALDRFIDEAQSVGGKWNDISVRAIGSVLRRTDKNKTPHTLSIDHVGTPLDAYSLATFIRDHTVHVRTHVGKKTNELTLA